MGKNRKYVIIFVLLVIIGAFFTLLFQELDSKLKPVSIKDNSIRIMDLEYDIQDIEKIELLDKVELNGGGGTNTKTTNNGYYKVNQDDFKSKVYIYKNISPFIRIKINNVVIIFNTDDSDKTHEIHDKLIELTK